MPSWPADLAADIRRDCAEASCDREPTWHCARCRRPLCAYHAPEDTDMCARCAERFAGVWARRGRRIHPIVVLVGVLLVGGTFAAWGLTGIRVIKWITIVIAPIILVFTVRAYRRKRDTFIDGHEDG